jgi:SWI/SNF-related matrix-associated actin-dependent regulator of chromatin subfamily A member 5
MNFNCPQHECYDCRQKTSDAGGMIYRCRWCERGYCEDCLDWPKAELLGDSLKEFELLGVSAVTQAFFICCPSCVEHHAANPSERDLCNLHAAEYDYQYQKLLDEKAADGNTTTKPLLPSSRADSLTDATTLEDSAVSTPLLRTSDIIHMSVSRKRKAEPDPHRMTPHKRVVPISP